MLHHVRGLIGCAVMLMVCALFPSRARGATPDQIDATIKKAQDYLIAQQKNGGRWETDAARAGNYQDWHGMQGSTWGGFTALSVYALLESGMSPNDSHIQQAVTFLKTADIVGVYALSVRLQVWLYMWQTNNHSPEYKALATADTDRLLKDLHTSGQFAGRWSYFDPTVKPDPPAADPNKLWWIDHSVNQYGILGLWAAEQMGVEIPSKVWQVFDETWRKDQYADGGWTYSTAPPRQSDASNHGRAETPSMTAAGIASLFIIQQYTHNAVGCNGNIKNPNIDNGMLWMARNFDKVDNLYADYGIERIGVASGYKYFGKIDWFASIADQLVKTQLPDGSWEGNETFCTNPLAATAFGLLFLARGGAPVMINKLDYSVVRGGKSHDANWNQRPRDAYNLARWSGEQSEADLNWQVVSLDVPVEELHDAPILYLAGDRDLNLSDADVAKLRQFVTEGGLILGNADCSSDKFAKSFVDLGQKLFPKYEFRELGKDHLIFHEPGSKFRGTPKVQGLSNGVRELMLLFPSGDPSRAWQSQAFSINTDAFRIGFNAFLYAVDTTGLRKKGVSYIVEADPAVAPTRTIKLARLMAGDNPNPEPGGWPRLAAILHNAPYSVNLSITEIKPDDDFSSYQLIHLTGTTSFKLTSQQRANLLQYTQHGGTLIVDAAGGSGAFADSAEAELNAIFGKNVAAGLPPILPPDSAVYDLPNASIKQVEYRTFARKNLVGKTTAPHVRGIEVNGRIVAFYSREDLSAGLVGEPVDGINGYSPHSATEIMRNLVLFSAK